jgi:CubicO group peptidase (beta-lactamase class C family)
VVFFRDNGKRVRYPSRMRVSQRATTILLLLCAFATGAPASAAAARGIRPKVVAPTARPLLPTEFRDVIERGVGNGGFRGVAVGLIDGTRHENFYFGHRDGALTPPPDADSRFEIGAVSEVFAGVLLAQGAIDGALRLNDPVAARLAAGFPFADPALAQATLVDLLTQKAGLPVRPANLFPADLDDPYAGYATEDLFAFLALQSRSAASAAAPSYSVLGAGLLGNLIGRAYATPYAEVLDARVLAPLGMTHTGFDDALLLPGHQRGDVAPHWHYGVLAAAAGLRSSLPDLVAFVQRNLVPGDSPLRAALLLARQARAPYDADQLGLGWKIREVASADATWPLIWRASETAGFAAFIGFRTDKQRAIVLLGNAAEDLADLGMAWLSELPPPASPHGYTTTTRPELASYPGLYKLNTGTEIVVRERVGGLSVQLPGSLPQSLRAVDKDVFASDTAALALTFIRNLDRIDGLVLRLGDDNVSAQRLSARAPRLARAGVRQSKEALAEYAADYRIGADDWLRVTVGDDALVVQPTMGEPLTLLPYARDRFSEPHNALELSGHRDEKGRIDRLVLDLAGVQREAIPLRNRPTYSSP